MNYSVTVLPGDGVGPEVIAEATKVLKAVEGRFGHSFDLSYGSVGGNAIDVHGTALPDHPVRRGGRPQVGRPQRRSPS